MFIQVCLFRSVIILTVWDFAFTIHTWVFFELQQFDVFIDDWQHAVSVFVVFDLVKQFLRFGTRMLIEEDGFASAAIFWIGLLLK